MFPIADDNPVSRPAVITWTILALCVLVFALQMALPRATEHALVLAFGLIPAVVTGEAILSADLRAIPPQASLVTSAFLHGGPLHIASNLLYLWVFGNNVEDTLGRGRFIVFYIVAAVLAGLCQVALDPGSVVPVIGASGAISAVLGAYLAFFPHAKVHLFIPVGVFVHPVPAAWVLLIWFLYQLASALLIGSGNSNVAWGAHLGGFIAGFGLAIVMRPRRVELFGHRPGPWG
ncbi:MAG: rhomboid family intramembrane serine protease [Geminicoccaceae bacterium]